LSRRARRTAYSSDGRCDDCAFGEAGVGGGWCMIERLIQGKLSLFCTVTQILTHLSNLLHNQGPCLISTTRCIDRFAIARQALYPLIGCLVWIAWCNVTHSYRDYAYGIT